MFNVKAFGKDGNPVFSTDVREVTKIPVAATPTEPSLSPIRESVPSVVISRVTEDGMVTNKGSSPRDIRVSDRQKEIAKIAEIKTTKGTLHMPLNYRSLSSQIGSSLGVYDLVIQRLKQNGLILEYGLGGDGAFSGHNAYRVASCKELQGMNLSHIQSYQKLKVADYQTIDDAIMVALNQVQTVFTGTFVLGEKYSHEELGMSFTVDQEFLNMAGVSDDKDANLERKAKTLINKKLNAIWYNFTSDNFTARASGAKFARDRDSWADMIQVDPRGIPCKRWVPTLDMFDPALSQITDEQLLPLLPGPEREATMLMLGRALLGREGAVWNIETGRDWQGKPTYDYQTLKNRCAVLWVGDFAGMGRSTTVENLQSAFRFLGYKAGAMDDLSRPFGQGKTATKDFAFVEDLSPEKTISYITSPQAKTMMSGGGMIVEEKGEPSYQVTAQCVLWFNTNRLDLQQIGYLDSGNLSRLLPMRNYGRTDRWYHQFKETYGHPMEVDQAVEYLSEQYGLGSDGSLVLTLLLLARSAVKYREYSGVGKKGLRPFVNDLDALRDQFQISVKMTHCQEIVQQYQMLYLAKYQRAPEVFDIPVMLNLITEWVRQGDGYRLLGVGDSPQQILANAANANSNAKRGSVTMCKMFFESLGSLSGNSYPVNRDYWINLFKQQFSQGQVILDGVDLQAEFEALREHTKLMTDIEPIALEYWEKTKFMRTIN